MSDWISVDDRLPDIGDRVLVNLSGDLIVLELREEIPTYEEAFLPFYYWHEPYDEMLDIEYDEVVHWMPLPPPPESAA